MLGANPVQLRRTRVWFRCPARGCGRRVAVLYSGGIFACRLCYQLVYETQRELPHYRALRRAQAIRMKLGGSGRSQNVFRPNLRECTGGPMSGSVPSTTASARHP